MVALWFISSSIILANTHIDPMFIYQNTGDTYNQSGAGIKLVTHINYNINFFIKPTYTYTSKKNNLNNEIKYHHMQGLLGVEYLYHFDTIPIGIVISGETGISHIKVDPKDTSSGLKKVEQNGIGWGAWAGCQYVMSQRVVPFIEIGYSKSHFKSDNKYNNISGFGISIGVQFIICGNIKPLFDPYE